MNEQKLKELLQEIIEDAYDYLDSEGVDSLRESLEEKFGVDLAD